MDFTIEYLSFFVIKVTGGGEEADKVFNHYQTLDEETYLSSPLKDFLDGELGKIAKRKVERHPKSDQVPTKIGYFTVEPGYELDSNPNYNLFQRLRVADSLDTFKEQSEKIVRGYLNTSSIRGGALIVIRAKLTKFSDEPYIFVLKCDFEQKVASVTDEQSLIKKVEMAITTKNMKSIQYPHMPEEGMAEEWELKIHQSSHSRYFEEFLKYVEYTQTITDMVKDRVIESHQQYISETYEEDSEERIEEEEYIEAWSNTAERQMQEKWTEDQVIEASSPLVENQPEMPLKLKLDHIDIKGLLSDFSDSIHIAKQNGRYIVLIEGESFSFDKDASPVEFLQPDTLENVIKRLNK
ncbi:DUF3900 domain-containing protein [Salipaludibacillus sp. CUR1]|uniref:DUF3900 domain-containing protein n=1 Tax=Salipaludibacillus sp. CUR1 TaxID=2820003 RepID=UPI001E2BC84B|nr:DUF3900 domain-containing protein [Salipaludibacillus sp. CUR1]MCE7794808.1 DUF3900 domain-containing protein [Salipaludibacillus sp. CUR1]